MKIVWPSALRETDHFQYPLETVYQTSRCTKLSQNYPLRIPILSEYCLFQRLPLRILNNCISLLRHGSSPRATVVPRFFFSIATQSLSKLHYSVNFSSYRYVHLFDKSWHNNHLQKSKTRNMLLHDSLANRCTIHTYIIQGTSPNTPNNARFPGLLPISKLRHVILLKSKT